MYKLIFADDEKLVVNRIRQIVDWESSGFTLVGCCFNGYEVLEMVEKELLTSEEAGAVPVPGIYRFFQSPLGQRILKADRVEREVAFNYTWEVAELFPEAGAGEEQLLVQGVIDLFFVEGNEVVLVDYKSDFIARDPADPHHSREAVATRYRPQIELYRRALEGILGQQVKESYLYLFYSEEALPIYPGTFRNH